MTNGYAARIRMHNYILVDFSKTGCFIKKTSGLAICEEEVRQIIEERDDEF